MNKIYQVLLIGGGASNLFSACYLSDNLPSGSIAIVEKLPRVGKKLIATGNGQCNLTNSNIDLSRYYSLDKNFFKYALTEYGNKSFEDFLKSIGIYLTGDGKRYPVSYEANSVLDLIREKLSSNGVSIFTENTVTEIKYKNGIFSVVTDKQTLLAKKVIFGCGGKSQKQFGTDGTAYSLLTALGHTVTELTPALVQLKTDTKTIKGLHGIKCDAVVKAFDKKGNLLKSQRSDVLFTDYGVSGLGVFQVSGHLLKENGSYLELEFLPDIDKNALKTLLEEKSKSAPYLDKEGLLNGLINKQLAKRIIAFYPDLITGIKNFKLAVIGSRGFDSSQVTKGGVSVSEVNLVTMESKFVKGLYIVGEVLDVDGDSGGYNLQWAYSSGRCASNAILKEQND